MTLRSFVEAWNTSFFSPQSPVPISLFRILYACLVILTLLLLRPDWLNWYGTHAWISLATIRQVELGVRLNLFTVIPANDTCIQALFWVFLASTTLLAIGFLTRLNSVVVFLCLTSIQQRNLFITHGGDTFLRVTGFFLIFAPAGAALSIDRLIRIRRGKEDGSIVPVSPWAQRMIQFELAILYFAAFCSKAEGAPWVEGTALFYVYHLDELHRFPLPAWFMQPLVLKLGSWATLALEFSLGVLIWIRDLRYYLLALGVLLHLCLEYSLNIPLFQWDILSAYVLFIDPVDLSRASKWIRGAVRLPGRVSTARRRPPRVNPRRRFTSASACVRNVGCTAALTDPRYASPAGKSPLGNVANRRSVRIRQYPNLSAGEKPDYW